MSNTFATAARTVAPFPVLLMAPPRGTDTGTDTPAPLTARLLWDAVRDFVLSATDSASYELELIEYELVYLAPRAVAWGRADDEAAASGRLDPFQEDNQADYDDWNETRNRFFELHCERARHAATLACLGFWRRAVLFGVARDEITPEKLRDLNHIATKAASGNRSLTLCAAFPARLIELMVVRDSNADEETVDDTPEDWPEAAPEAV